MIFPLRFHWRLPNLITHNPFCRSGPNPGQNRGLSKRNIGGQEIKALEINGQFMFSCSPVSGNIRYLVFWIRPSKVLIINRTFTYIYIFAFVSKSFLRLLYSAPRKKQLIWMAVMFFWSLWDVAFVLTLTELETSKSQLLSYFVWIR